jgi:hypothetical protein
MFMVVRKYRVMGSPEEAAQRIEAGLVPILRQIPGFTAYYTFADGSGHALSVSVFEGEEAARASGERAVAWARENLAEFIGDQPPEVSAGEVLVAATG